MLLSDIFSFLPETVALAANATLTITPIPGQTSVTVKYLSGGTLTIMGVTYTVGATTYATAGQQSLKYVLGASEIFNFDGRGSFVLLAEGVTTLFAMIRGRGAQVVGE